MPHDTVKVQGHKNHEEALKTTIARLERIQSQLKDSPRGLRLKDKVCIVTGVGSLKGIGRASAIRFAHEGAKHLYLLDYDPTNLPNLKATIEEKYPDVKVTTMQADASDEKAISDICALAMKEEGRLDVFFANAGIATYHHLDDATPESFMRLMRVNALSCFLAIKHASLAMREANPARGKKVSGGSIILTASTAGLRSGAGPVDYSASKAAVNNMAQTCLIETAMTSITFEFARERGTTGKIGQLNPLGRFGIPEEIATVATYLASDESSYINGQNIAVDGGLSASLPVIPGRWV